MGSGRHYLKRGISYLKRNGVKESFYKAVERLARDRNESSYELCRCSESELSVQREKKFTNPYRFSILVPVYNTEPDLLRQTLDSVGDQTYTNWELILADASPDDLRRNIVRDFIEDYSSIHREDRFGSFFDKVKYVRLEENKGISGNTNEALSHSSGDYVGLLDHDDLLEPDALYEVMNAIEEAEKEFREHDSISRIMAVYTDEDKVSEDGSRYFDPNFKPDFDPVMLTTNNYICHFFVADANLAKSVGGFRSEYDGAQDYDLFLRAVKSMEDPDAETLHVPKILYHGRVHALSTAGNTDAKEYAYEAGRRAVDDYCKSMGWAVTVSHTAHLGFYHIEYKNLLFSTRPYIGMLCGPLYKFGKVCGGAMREDGTVVYRGLTKGMGGYMHRGSLIQEVEAADVRNMRINPVLENLYDEMVESKLAKNAPDYVGISLEFCKKVRELGYKILYDPDHKQE